MILDIICRWLDFLSNNIFSAISLYFQINFFLSSLLSSYCDWSTRGYMREPSCLLACELFGRLPLDNLTSFRVAWGIFEHKPDRVHKTPVSLINPILDIFLFLSNQNDWPSQICKAGKKLRKKLQWLLEHIFSFSFCTKFESVLKVNYYHERS